MRQNVAGDARRAVRRTARVCRELESLGAVIKSMGRETELRPLLTHVLVHACELIGADDGAIGLVDEARNVVRTEATYRMPPGELGAEVLPGVGLAGEVLRTGAPVRLTRYGDLPLLAQPDLREHAVIGTPVTWDGHVIGFLGLGRSPRPRADGARGRARAFSIRDVNALEVFADHAAIAIENARRYARERQRTERLALIARVGRLVTADLRLDELLQRAADAIHELLGYENVAIPLIAPEDPGTMVLANFGGAYKHLIGGEHRIPITAGLMGAAARTREVVLVNDVAADPRYLPTPGREARGAELAVPILLGARVLGVLNVERMEAFGDEDAAGLRIVADQLAIAIDNARLHHSAQRAAALEERHRLARELHDSVTQLLFSATLIAQSVAPAYARDPGEGDRRAGKLLDLNRAALGEMRALLTELRPMAAADGPRIAPGGLPAALRRHAAQVAPSGLHIFVEDAGYARQSPAHEEALYRIAREALHNVVKHARASRVELRLSVRDGVARLLVRDDGVGIAVAADSLPLAGRSGGLGLVTMRERAMAIGGDLHIDSTPGRGTVVEVAFPARAEGPR